MYPATFNLQPPERLSRVYLILRPLMALPVLLWAVIYTLFAGFVHFLSSWATVITGRHPQVLWDVLEGYFRFAAKIHAYMMYLTDAYPPFTGGAEAPHPIRIHVEYPGRMSRATVFFRPLILFPHYFSCIGGTLLYMVVHFLNFWSILFLGRLSRWQRERAERYFIYMSRLAAYGLLLVDEYPPFNGLQPKAAEVLFG